MFLLLGSFFLATTPYLNRLQGHGSGISNAADNVIKIRFSVPSRLQNRALLLRDTETIWCKSFCGIDYSATIETGTGGVAVLDHLANLYYWAVSRNGSHTIPVGEPVTFR